jgi:hypothetical protein
MSPRRAGGRLCVVPHGRALAQVYHRATNDLSENTMQPAPYFHEPSDSVRFWVLADDGNFVGACITQRTLHFRFQAERGEADAMASYMRHHDEIDAAVRQRIAAGSIEPVMLREADLPAPARR